MDILFLIIISFGAAIYSFKVLNVFKVANKLISGFILNSIVLFIILFFTAIGVAFSGYVGSFVFEVKYSVINSIFLFFITLSLSESFIAVYRYIFNKNNASEAL